MTLRPRNHDAYTSQNAPVLSDHKKPDPKITMDASSGSVEISYERLAKLEALEASLPTLIQNAILEYKKSNLRRLHEKDKANPENVNKRVKRYAEKHKDEINAKRREKRRLQKLSATAAPAQSTPLTVVNPNGNYVPFD